MGGFFGLRRGNLATYETLFRMLRLVEDVEREITPVDRLELFTVFRDREEWISGEELRLRAKEARADFGEDQATYLLEGEGKIPAEWREAGELLFPGAVFQAPSDAMLWPEADSDLFVRSLEWTGDGWRPGFYWLGGVVRPFGSLLRESPAS